MAKRDREPRNGNAMRIGQAAELLGISTDTLRRWAASGKIRVQRSIGGQRLVGLAELRRLQGKRRARTKQRPIVAQSARNRFPGFVTRVERDRVAAVVEVQAGPHRLVSLMTAEAAGGLGLRPRRRLVFGVKAHHLGGGGAGAPWSKAPTRASPPWPLPRAG